MIHVRLSSDDLAESGLVAVSRYEYARQHGYAGGNGQDPLRDGLTPDLIGAAAELAVAHALAIKWQPIIGSDKGRGDVGDLQVRATERRGGHLLLQRGDDDEGRYVLVTGHRPWLSIVGWIRGRKGKVTRYWREPRPGRPCYMIPQAALTPLVLQPRRR